MTISTIIRIGKGTLAPWSPTRKLVIGSMYGHVRNPMIMGVLIVLTGEAISIMSSLPINTLFLLITGDENTLPPVL